MFRLRLPFCSVLVEPSFEGGSAYSILKTLRRLWCCEHGMPNIGGHTYPALGLKMIRRTRENGLHTVSVNFYIVSQEPESRQSCLKYHGMTHRKILHLPSFDISTVTSSMPNWMSLEPLGDRNSNVSIPSLNSRNFSRTHNSRMLQSGMR